MGWENLDNFGGASITIREGIYPPEIYQQNDARNTNFFNSTTIEIMKPTEANGNDIIYTIDGNNWITYTSPFTIEHTCTVAARFTKDGDLLVVLQLVLSLVLMKMMNPSTHLRMNSSTQ